jgi:hypothetical protein
MSHFAKLNKDNIVVDLIKSEQDFINSGRVGDSFLWVQTSYNNNFRRKYASIGDTYDKTKDAFISPQPYASWTLNEETYLWECPIAYPIDATDDLMYSWDEDTTSWVEITGE